MDGLLLDIRKLMSIKNPGLPNPMPPPSPADGPRPQRDGELHERKPRLASQDIFLEMIEPTVGATCVI